MFDVSKIAFPGRISYELCIFQYNVLLDVLFFLGWIYVQWIYLQWMGIKDFMEMIRKHSSDDCVKCPGVRGTLSLGYSQGQQKHRPGGSVLPSVKHPRLSEAADVLHRQLGWHQFIYFPYKLTISLKEVLFKCFHTLISDGFSKTLLKSKVIVQNHHHGVKKICRILPGKGLPMK